MNQITHNQHTVPMCYLKSFGTHLWVFDKKTKRWEYKKIKKISVIQDVYEHLLFLINEFENFLQSKEDIWSKRVRDVLNGVDNSYIMDSETLDILYEFIWTLQIRTVSSLEDIKESIGSTIKFLKNNNAAYSFIKDLEKDYDPEKIRLDILRTKNELRKYHSMVMLSTKSPLFTSDNPICGLNDFSKNWVSPEYTRYFPIFPNLCICLLDNRSGPFDNITNKILEYDNSRFLNILQVFDAYRYVYVQNELQKKELDSIANEYPESIDMNRKRTGIREILIPGTNDSLLHSFKI